MVCLREEYTTIVVRSRTCFLLQSRVAKLILEIEPLGSDHRTPQVTKPGNRLANA